MLKDIKDRPYYSAFTRIVLLAAVLWLTGCATPNESARSWLDRLEFEGDEYGAFELEGNIDAGGIPFVGATVHIKLQKTKDKPGAPLVTEP